MKLKIKLLSSMILILSVMCLIYPSNVQAALQSNGGTPATRNVEQWLKEVRNMETLGGTLGLQDTIDETNLTSSASEKNNIDIHMQKNTEYGAMAILSASAYGNQEKIENGGTTTGNKSGIYINIGPGEWVSAGTLSASSVYTNANLKYKNMYNITYVPRIGDAITETTGWYGGETTYGTRYVDGSVWNSVSAMSRSTSGSLFAYHSYLYGVDFNGHVYRGYDGSQFFYAMPSRAVIVCGKGF